jgi:hypothetical protein
VRRGQVYIQAYDQTAARNCIVASTDGTNPTLRFFGADATPVARQTVTGSRASGAALLSLIIAIDNLGLITNSSTA